MMLLLLSSLAAQADPVTPAACVSDPREMLVSRCLGSFAVEDMTGPQRLEHCRYVFQQAPSGFPDLDGDGRPERAFELHSAVFEGSGGNALWIFHLDPDGCWRQVADVFGVVKGLVPDASTEGWRDIWGRAHAGAPLGFVQRYQYNGRYYVAKSEAVSCSFGFPPLAPECTWPTYDAKPGAGDVKP